MTVTVEIAPDMLVAGDAERLADDLHGDDLGVGKMRRRSTLCPSWIKDVFCRQRMSLGLTGITRYDTGMEKNAPSLPHSPSPWSKTEADKFFYGALTEKIIACAITVHKELGPGFLEKIYEKAFVLELIRWQISFRSQLPVHIRYHGELIGLHCVDLLIDGKVVVELKAVKEIDDAHLATCLSYLKANRLRVGLIINFSQAKTRIKRVMRADDFLTTEKGSEGDREGS